MCVLYVSFGFKVRPRTFGCVAMGSTLLFFICPDCSYIALSGFSVRSLCFVQAKTLCRNGCMYFLAPLVLVCVDVIVMSSA